MRYLLLLIVCISTTTLSAGDWVTARSYYTHHPVTGQRVNQYSQPPSTAVQEPPSFRSSGFRHYRSSLQYGPSADHYHRVEQWGPPIQPYGEWRFPYRPYSAPYSYWGPPYAGLNLGGVGYPGLPLPLGNNGAFPGLQGNLYPQPYQGQPYADGAYEDRGARPRLNDEQFYKQPNQTQP